MKSSRLSSRVFALVSAFCLSGTFATSVPEVEYQSHLWFIEKCINYGPWSQYSLACRAFQQSGFLVDLREELHCESVPVLFLPSNKAVREQLRRQKKGLFEFMKLSIVAKFTLAHVGCLVKGSGETSSGPEWRTFRNLYTLENDLQHAIDVVDFTNGLINFIHFRSGTGTIRRTALHSSIALTAPNKWPGNSLTGDAVACDCHIFFIDQPLPF